MTNHSSLKGSRVLPTLVSLCLFPGIIEAQNFTSFTEWPVPTAFSGPLGFALSGNNGAYFSEFIGGKIGFLDMNKNVITEWTLPANSYPVEMVSQGQKVAFAEESSHIAVLDPNGSSLTEWAVPMILQVPVPLAVGTQGKSIFFSDIGQGVIGMVNSSSNEMTLWPMPGAPFRAPVGIVVVGATSALQVWVGGSDRKISLLNPASNTFTEWTIPAAGFAGVPDIRKVAVDSDGSVVFVDAVNSTVGVLNPTTNIIRQWFVPTANSRPMEVAVLTPGVAAFTESSATNTQPGNRMGTLDLSTTPDREAAVAPGITTVTPIVQVVSPKITALARTITLVTPVVTGASRVVGGGFVEYIVPTPLSSPWGLATDSNRGILFTEYIANKIGLLH